MMGMGSRKRALVYYWIAVLIVLNLERKSAAAQQEEEGKVHHVVGEDRGWERSTDVAGWAAGRIFRVGDSLWFAYSAAEEETIVEVGSIEEYERCDVSSPIRMYTDGLSEVVLERKGTRYFTSANLESCKSGLRLSIPVEDKHPLSPEMIMMTIPQSEKAALLDLALAAAPVSPPPPPPPPIPSAGIHGHGAAALGSLLFLYLCFAAAAIL